MTGELHHTKTPEVGGQGGCDLQKEREGGLH